MKVFSLCFVLVLFFSDPIICSCLEEIDRIQKAVWDVFLSNPVNETRNLFLTKKRNELFIHPETASWILIPSMFMVCMYNLMFKTTAYYILNSCSLLFLHVCIYLVLTLAFSVPRLCNLISDVLYFSCDPLSPSSPPNFPFNLCCTCVSCDFVMWLLHGADDVVFAGEQKVIFLFLYHFGSIAR